MSERSRNNATRTSVNRLLVRNFYNAKRSRCGLSFYSVISGGGAREVSPPPGREELAAAVKTNTMQDLCNQREGTKVFQATSTDESNPPEAIIDGCVGRTSSKYCTSLLQHEINLPSFIFFESPAHSFFTILCALYCHGPKATRTLSG